MVLTMLLSFIPVIAHAAKSGTCGNNLTWTLDDEGTLTISGEGAMTNLELFNEKQVNLVQTLEKINILKNL